MADSITDLLQSIEAVTIDGNDHLDDSLRTLVTHDQKLTTWIDKAKITGTISI